MIIIVYYHQKPSSKLKPLVKQFHNATPENGNGPETIASSKYHDIVICITLKYLTKINRFPYSFNYSCEFTPNETSPGGTLLYIDNHLSYKRRNDLNIYKKSELESNFIEIVNPKKLNIIVGVIYRHPSMDLPNFNCNYLNKLLENISEEQKSIFLLGHFSVELICNVLNYNGHQQTNKFLGSLASN